MDELEGLRESKPRDASTLALLSLYLLTLAFFILLNTISQQETDRTRAAMGSLDATFSRKIMAAEEPEPVGRGRGPQDIESDFQTHLLRLFEAHMPFARYQILQRGTVMRIFLPTDSLFEKDSATLRPSRQPVLVGIADGLAGSAFSGRREVQFMIGAGPALPSALASGKVLELDRAGAFARALQGLGVMPGSIGVGLKPGDPGEVQLTFYSRPEGTAKVDFEELER